MAKSMRSKSRRKSKAILRDSLYLPMMRERLHRLNSKSEVVPDKVKSSEPNPMEVIPYKTETKMLKT